MNLDQFSDSDLKAELKRREEVAKEQELQRRHERAEFLASKVDLLLELIPEHTRTSCDDTNVRNSDRCTRCYLLCCKSSGVWDSFKELNIYISELKPIYD